MICGETVLPDQRICPSCKNYITPKGSINDAEYWREKSMKLIGNYSYWHQILIDEEISENPQYNPNTTMHNAKEEAEGRISKSQSKKYTHNVMERMLIEMTGKSKRECHKILKRYGRK